MPSGKLKMAAVIQDSHFELVLYNDDSSLMPGSGRKRSSRYERSLHLHLLEQVFPRCMLRLPMS